MSAVHAAIARSIEQVLAEWDYQNEEAYVVDEISDRGDRIRRITLREVESNRRATIYQIDGRWIVARWSDEHAQYQSEDLKPERKYYLAVGDTLSRLLNDGSVREYKSAAAALRAALSNPYRERT